eukprot:12940303-Alexandrium_andersonii.AAC.1
MPKHVPDVASQTSTGYTSRGVSHVRLELFLVAPNASCHDSPHKVRLWTWEHSQRLQGGPQ